MTTQTQDTDLIVPDKIMLGTVDAVDRITDERQRAVVAAAFNTLMQFVNDGVAALKQVAENLAEERDDAREHTESAEGDLETISVIIGDLHNAMGEWEWTSHITIRALVDQIKQSLGATAADDAKDAVREDILEHIENAINGMLQRDTDHNEYIAWSRSGRLAKLLVEDIAEGHPISPELAEAIKALSNVIESEQGYD